MSAGDVEAAAIFRLTPRVRSWSFSCADGTDDAAVVAGSVCTGIEVDDEAEPVVVAVKPDPAD